MNQNPADDGPRILTEAEAEKLQAQSDQLADRVMARIDRDGDPANLATIIDEEFSRARRERGDPEPTPEEQAERDSWVEAMNASAAEAMRELESEKWKREEKAPPKIPGLPHPLSARTFALSVRAMREPIDQKWLTPEATPEHPLVELGIGVSKAGARLASALDGEWPPPMEFCAIAIVRLKKAAAYLDDALMAAESCRDDGLGERVWVEEVTNEVHHVRAAAMKLISELRARLGA